MSGADSAIRLAAEIIVSVLDGIGPFKWFRTHEQKVNLQQQQLALLKSLTEIGVHPELFDFLLSTEVDRMLKVRFGVAFFVATIAFTASSFAVVVLNSVYKWGISDVAITGLIIETPLQFIGLLYIIARNLFPQATPRTRSAAAAKPKSKVKKDPAVSGGSTPD